MNKWRVLVGDVREQLAELSDQSVQCVVTSPPYWGLRDYGTATWDGGDPDCEHNARTGDLRFTHPISEKQRSNAGSAGSAGSACLLCGARRIDSQIGLEPTPDAYVAALVEVFQGVWRVLKDDGVCWLNLGDSYNSGTKFSAHNGLHPADRYEEEKAAHRPLIGGLKAKDLVGIPWAVAFALRADGWYLRADIIWAKKNCMPESVTDRPTKSHEYIFLLSKAEQYFYDSDAIKEPLSIDTIPRYFRGRSDNHKWADGGPGDQTLAHSLDHMAHKYRSGNKQRDIPSADDGRGIPNDHLRRGVPWEDDGKGRNCRSVWTITTQPYPEAHFATFPEALPERCIKAGSRIGDTVLDPFCGSGTTGRVAVRLGRHFIGVELNPVYAELARERIGNAAPLFSAEARIELGEATAQTEERE